MRGTESSAKRPRRDEDELARAFSSAASVDAALARRRLEACGWDLARALDAHFSIQAATTRRVTEARAVRFARGGGGEGEVDRGPDAFAAAAEGAARASAVAFAADADGWFRSMPLEAEAEAFTADALVAFVRLVSMGEGGGWRDDSFLAAPSSVDGRAGASGTSASAPKCRCGIKAKVKQVYKDGATQGRLFYACEKRTDRCDFFAWAREDTLEHTESAKALTWKRFAPPRFKFARRMSAADIRQGSVGDCWFLSSLAVIAEREDLLESIVGVSRRYSEIMEKFGAYFVRLFLGGRWRAIVVDDMLPVKPKKNDDFSPAFSRASNNQLWVSIVEKAYAKAHGSYAAISGGYVAEGLHDLTGSATEQISFLTSDFDSEDFWIQLLSFSSAGYPLGCATSFSAGGIVGHHAYSILEVRELTGVKKGVQTKLTDVYSRGKDALNTETEDLRLLKIRNPWGRKEWRGEFSSNSEAWTKRLGDVLSRTRADDGEFWMSYHDFLVHFSSVDVCKSPRGWHSMNLETKLDDSSELPPTFIVRSGDDGGCWTHVLLLQHTKRGRPHGHWYTDLSVLAWSREIGSDGAWTPIGGIFGTRERESCQGEIMLDAGCEYAFQVLSVAGGRDVPVTLRLCSAKPIRARPGGTNAPTSTAQNVHLAILGQSSITGGAKFRLSHLSLCGGVATTATSSGLNFVFVRADATRASELEVQMTYRFREDRGTACYQPQDVISVQPGGSRIAVVASGVSPHSRHACEFHYLVKECACGIGAPSIVVVDDACVLVGESKRTNEADRFTCPEVAPMRCRALFEPVDAAFWPAPSRVPHASSGSFKPP